MEYTQDLRENYTPEQHRQLIDIVFGLLDKEQVASDIEKLFSESGFETYLQARVGLRNKIICGGGDEMVKEHGRFCLEIAKLLQYPLWFKKPLSYKHISYDEFKPGVDHKFIVFTDYTGAVGYDDIVLLTGTGATQHKDHLGRFLSDNAGTMPFSSSLPYLDNLGGGWVKYTDEGIMPHSSSGGLGPTSETMRKIIFETLFPDEQIVLGV